MKRLLAVAVLAAAGGLGCGTGVSTGGGGGAVGTVAGLDSVFDVPTVEKGAVRVQLRNRSAQDAEARVTMRVLGTRVHFSSRLLRAGSNELVVGPDEADSVLVEITLLGESSTSLPARAFFLHREFQPGEAVVVELPPAQTPVEPGADVIDSPDVEVIPVDGTDIVDVEEPGGGGVVELPDGGATDPPANGSGGGTAPGESGEIDPAPNPTPIDPSVPSPTEPFEPTPPPAQAPGSEGGTGCSADLAFDSPPDGYKVVRGHHVVIGWAGRDDRAAARISIFLDVDKKLNGNEIILIENVPEEDFDWRDLKLDTAGIAPGKYWLGGVIGNEQCSRVCWGGRIVIQ
jgi:hypothetical protein